eukprot:CAMPEP_0170481750 /NCGR_PEP_ID=MMETSP0208-20121228/2072_1 /TAXON_ID=197538 /ORGANISM="Strombidium inclinatum, Strain S3" /LENGTH=76 /DNA_ID=CAMNT_0010754509 /DNA_START=913 /DNA_END=1143 /DNA_ORIENTATION=+
MDYFKQAVDQKLLEVDQLVNGDNFAEKAFIKKEPIEFSVITKIPTEMYILEEFEMAKLDPQFLAKLLALTKPFPSD